MGYNENFNELRINCDLSFFRDILNFYHEYMVESDVDDGALSFNDFLKNSIYSGASRFVADCYEE